jgi:ribosomal protein S18 acetylase RimI-like enzyme
MEDTIYIAETKNQVVGFITLRINGVGNIGAYIRMVAVTEDYRGKGIGKELINFVEEKAFEKLKRPQSGIRCGKYVCHKIMHCRHPRVHPGFS